MRYRCGAFFSRTLSVACITASISVCGAGSSLAQDVKPATPLAATVASKPVSAPQAKPADKPLAKAPAGAVSAPKAATPTQPAASVAQPAKVKPVAAASSGASKPESGKLSKLDERAQALKKEVQQLNQELQSLEKAVLYPPSGQLAVFVSTGPIRGWVLESIELKLADKVVAQHLYTASEQAALQRGGVQRLHIGAVRMGEQELLVSITGQSLQGRAVKHTSPVKFDKGADPKYVQLRIEDIGTAAQPGVAVKVGQ